jgi:hypothetical protein
MKNKIFFFIFLFITTYLLGSTSVLYTESFILFLASMVIFLLFISTKEFTFNYNKDDFKWNETILFYIILKNWHRSLIRDNNIKIANFLLLSLQIQKYEIEWLKKNLDKITKRDYLLLTQTTLRRLEILSNYKNLMKSESKVFGLRRLPIVPIISSYTKKNDVSSIESTYDIQLKKIHPMYYELVHKLEQVN